MRIASTIRNVGFWTIDTIKGGNIKKHYQDILHVMDDPFSKKSTENRNNLLDKLLEHSTKTVPFYSPYKQVNFKKLPIISKDLILNNFDDFKSNKFKANELHKVSTSGSTGIPFLLFIDQNKRNRNIADTLFFFKKVGYNIGDRLYYFRLWNGERKSELRRILQNIVKVNISKMTDDFVKDLLNELRKDHSSKCVIAIASSLETLCKYIDKNNLKNINVNIKSFIANSEALSDYTKESIEKHFNATIVSRYSNEEQGIIAQQKPDNNNYFQINWASYFVEIIHMDEDIPTKLGEMGRIVVTDLFNYSMPLIRYDTGDIGVMELINNEPVLTKVEGRKMDLIYDATGDLISSYSVYPVMDEYNHLIKQYQFIQIGKKEYLIKLNIDQEFTHKEKLIKKFKDILGSDAEITIELVNEIPELSSGKRKKVMNTSIQNYA
ncbi:phenylacetate--CoA ligase family protein [Arenibacter latericius]|uniref:phenylacetate--CoA ligase family protein n=1 Tax=Arenibacter latericius TaxID=86104 RepID=UPI00041EBE9A|nr:phenylacetate--CoA ligase family protein [Arenibacter latericius]MDX1362871.1 phenylacetate--CoA ligase family protein [Arenibacter latericius]